MRYCVITLVLKKTELKNSFPVTFSALRINLQKFTIFPTQSWLVEQFLVMTRVIYKTQRWLASILFLLFVILNHFQSALNITGLWLPGSRKKFDVRKLKIFKRWVPLNFSEPKNCYGWFPMISVGYGNAKLFSFGTEIQGSK